MTEANTRSGHSIKAYRLPGAPEDSAALLRPARPTRQWMDATAGQYAYRCIPLTAANTMGWEYLNPVTCEFRWGGMTAQEDVQVWLEDGHRWRPRTHFGSGVVTWELPFLFRTEPGYGLVVCGPANCDKTGIVPLDGFIRTDWLPYPFTMNWRITRRHHSVRFEAGEPIARIFPYPLGLLEETVVEIAEFEDDPELVSQFRLWAERRKQNAQQHQHAQAKANLDDRADTRGLWTRAYAHGEGAQQHQTVFKPGRVVDKNRD
ncbi:MAG: hypothetical protein Tsb0027_04480 [Wenzhouxiangellaceae bacterium]